jgi:hypothetical protein
MSAGDPVAVADPVPVGESVSAGESGPAKTPVVSDLPNWQTVFSPEQVYLC